MKYLIIALVSLMLLIPAAMGNTVTQNNYADAKGDGWCGHILQSELNTALVIGQGNTLTQTNDQKADSHMWFGVDQFSTNMALVIGNTSTITQDNLANASGGFTYQSQLNNVLVIGDTNTITQKNNATAMELRNGFGNMITQDQTNLGLVIGIENTLNQYNEATAEIPKNCDTDPLINQIQTNMALLISGLPEMDDCPNCHRPPR